MITLAPAATRAELKGLARTWNEHTRFMREVTVCSLVGGAWDDHSHPFSDTCVCGDRCMACAWFNFMDAVLRLDGLLGEPWAGLRTPADFDEAFTGDPMEQAHWTATEHVEAALNLLLHGERAMLAKVGAR